MDGDNRADREIVVLGGGLTGLSAGLVLARAGRKVRVLERDVVVGGLSRTVVRGGFRFDIGGHRFFTKNKTVDDFVRGLMGEELLQVRRSSKIYLRNRFFDYPLKPANAIFGLGVPTTLRILADYGLEKAASLIRDKRHVSLEDWVVGHFGRTMFTIYFKEYSEKVWGIDCSRISAEWVAQRIKGLSLGKAIKNAFVKVSGRDLPTLADSFLYPRLGIGRISERLKEDIEMENEVLTGVGVTRINHDGLNVESVDVESGGFSERVYGREFVSSLPVTSVIRMLNPAAPSHIIEAASRLKFRDIVVVAVMVDRKRVTDQTWIYIPEKRIPFGRIHEPTNWSESMAPEGKTVLVMEFFSFQGDETWTSADGLLIDMTVKHLDALGFISKSDVVDAAVVRAPKAYPLFEVGFKDLCQVVYSYLAGFKNLHMAGRSGMFQYYNMDHAIESGMLTAGRIIARQEAGQKGRKELLLAGS